MHKKECYELLSVKRVIVRQAFNMMRKQKITRCELAKRMNVSRATLSKLLNPNDVSLSMSTLINAASVMGYYVQVKLVCKTPPYPTENRNESNLDDTGCINPVKTSSDIASCDVDG